MNRTTVIVDSTGTPESLATSLNEVARREGVQALFVLACAGNGWTPELLDPILQAQTFPVIGGVFPAILSDRTKMERGTIVTGLTMPVRSFYVDGLSDEAADFSARIDATLSPATGPDRADTVLVLLDAFASRIDDFLESLYAVLGLERTYLGGGAGTLAMDGSAGLLSNRGLTGGGALVTLLDTPSSLGVSHGWTPVAGPFRVTDSAGTEIHTLDWSPAFDVYREVIREAGGGEITKDDFFTLAGAYPFGIPRMEEELVVRDPFSVRPDGTLVCIGGVPNGSFIHVLHGDEDSLITAAAEARRKCGINRDRVRDLERHRNRDRIPRDDTRCLRVFFDCVSRVLFLGERFAEELAAVHEDSLRLIGACSIGEVANNGDSYLEFYNKTAVVADIECEI